MEHKTLSPFHLAIPVHNLEDARDFYGRVLGCEEGRSDQHWIDYDFFGHQLVVHLNETGNQNQRNEVDGHAVPVPHFGVVLKWEDWEQLAKRAKEFGIQFLIEPYIRFKGQVGEQATMFFLDPSQNALEFKAFRDIGQLFAK